VEEGLGKSSKTRRFKYIGTLALALGIAFVVNEVQADFLEDVKANDLMLDTIETPSDSILQMIGDVSLDSWYDYWFGKIEYFAMYSPDSSKVAEERQDKPGRPIGLWIVDHKTATEEQIVDGVVSDSKWSRSGRYIAFTTMTPVEMLVQGGLSQAHDRGLWVYDVDSKQVAIVPVVAGAYYQWSPAGDFLACKHLDSAAQWQLTVYEAEKKKAAVLDRVMFSEPWNFSWSPNGEMLAYVLATKAEGHVECSPVESEVYVINRNGSGKTQITTTPQPEILVKWQPDGKSIMVERFIEKPWVNTGGGETEIVRVKLRMR
jgi:Tol biopolymer transport system component